MNIRACFAALALLAASGCTMMAPNYATPVENADAAAKLPAPIAVGKFTFKPGEESSLNSVGARADTFTSPTHGSYAEYIEVGAKSDLRAAGKLSDTSAHVLTGMLEKNRLSAAGFDKNDAQITMRFKLAQGDRVDFDKSVSVSREWESSFLGGIAIPRAINNYVVTVQKLLLQLYTDPEFASAVGKH